MVTFQTRDSFYDTRSIISKKIMKFHSQSIKYRIIKLKKNFNYTKGLKTKNNN